MAKIRTPDVVKPIYGLLYREEEVYQKTIQRIESQYGRIDFISDEFSFSHSDYYDDEMGTGLLRRFLSLEALIYPDQIVQFKHLSNLWEEEFSAGEKRTVNIDPGYLDTSKLVLSSAKNFSHRNYIGQGIYAEVTMPFAHGDFYDLPWTYPDYSQNKAVFRRIVDIYKKQRQIG